LVIAGRTIAVHWLVNSLQSRRRESLARARHVNGNGSVVD
jgi:hypothetical protein